MVGNILGECLFESVLTIWCSSLLEGARPILSVQNLHLDVCTSFETIFILIVVEVRRLNQPRLFGKTWM